MTVKYTRLAAIVAVLAVLAGCQVQFVSDYDPDTDQNVSALQKKVSEHLIGLMDSSPPDCLYDQHEAFYVDALSDTQVILTRAEAINVNGLNDLTVEQITLTNDSLIQVRDLHRGMSSQQPPACMSKAAVEDFEILLQKHFEAILRFELAKKRTVTKAKSNSGGS